MVQSCGRWIPVLIVLSVIGSCYAVFTMDFLLREMESDDAATHERAVMHTVVFNVLFALGLLSFFRTIFDDPGRVPASWVLGTEEEEQGSRHEPSSLPALETKHDGSRRVCRKSDPPVYKPDRAHFCRQLDRCVLKMDHFCPWTNSCIGFGNHKFFMLFIFYMVSTLVFVVLLLLPDFSRYIEGRELGVQPSQEEFRVSFVFLALCQLGSALIPFFCFHSYLVTANYTTIEFLEKRGCNPPPDHVNRYDIGVCSNVSAVLGRNPLFWLLPVRWFNDGDGLSFELNPDWVNKGKAK